MHAVEFVIESREIGFWIPGRKGMISWSIDVGYNSSPRRNHSIVRFCQSEKVPNKISTGIESAKLDSRNLEYRRMITPIQHLGCSWNLIQKLIIRTWKLNLHVLLTQEVWCLSRRRRRKSV